MDGSKRVLFRLIGHKTEPKLALHEQKWNFEYMVRFWERFLNMLLVMQAKYQVSCFLGDMNFT